MLLVNKVFIVTGASSGIGEELSRQLSKEGAKVVCAARTKDKLQKISEEINSTGGKSIYIQTDITDLKQCHNLINRTIEDFGQIDGWRSQNIYPCSVGDVNDDGKADVVGFGNACVYVALSNGKGFDESRLWVKDDGKQAGGWSSNNFFPCTVGDVNGDGLDDIVGFRKEGVFVSLSNRYSFQDAIQWSNQFDSTKAWLHEDRYPCVLGDVNDDGFADIVIFGNAGVYVVLSNGKWFNESRLCVKDYGYEAGG